MQPLSRLLSIGLIGAIVVASTAQAERSRIGSLPLRPRVAGFSMTADLEVVAGNGYQPVYLTFSPLGKSFTRDRHLQIVFGPRNYHPTELDFDFRRSITVPEGSATFSMPIYVPHYYPWETVQISLFEDGRLIETGKESFGLGSGLRARFAEQRVSVGIIAPADAAVQDAAWKIYPDVRTLVTVLGEGPIPEVANFLRLPHAAAIKQANIVQPAWVQFRPIDELQLPDQWLGYSQLDVIIVPAPVLERIAAQQPKKTEQLISWLAAGGNLWIYAVNPADHHFVQGLGLDSTDRSKKMLLPGNVATRLQLKADNDTSVLVYEPWNGVQKESTRYSFRSNQALSKRDKIYKELQKQEHPFAQTIPVSELASGLRFGSFGLGSVVTIASEDPFPGSFQFWQSIVDVHDSGQIPWTDRMGIDVPRGNDNYWMWLIPSVGQPPVKSFVLLNTLFVILVGPVCYFFFRNRGRLYLLYFFAPCMALLVTVCLFAYALAADGIRTKVRSRQLTWIDSQNAYAVGQSRQTYYTVLGSGSGIELPTKAAIYPVRHTPAYNRNYRRRGPSSHAGKISVSDDSQRLSGDFLPPRNQVQYLITHPKSIERALEFSLSPQAVTVSSHLPQTLSRLLVCDASRNYWEAENVNFGRSVKLKPSTAKVLEELLGNDVLPPLGSVPMLQNNQRNWGGPGTGMQVSLLENRLQQWSRRMPPGTFVATAELDEDRLGVEGALVLDSVHVMMGEIP